MDIDELSMLERVKIHQIDGLDAFLQNRPKCEDFGESLDYFRDKMIKCGTLNETNDAIIRGLHLHHQKKILNRTNPFNTTRTTSYIDSQKKFAFLSDLYYNIDCYNSINDIRNFSKRYISHNDMYIYYELFEQFYRLHAYTEAVDILRIALKTLYGYSNDIWDNKESCYGAALLVSKISFLFQYSDLARDDIGEILKSIVRMSYILLTRVICWPYDSASSDDVDYKLPIAHEHRIATLLRRIDLLDRYYLFFKDLIPSISTVDTLIVSDYYFAHELSFATNTLGRKSEFKRDARNKYKSIKEDCIRPFSTCISDGKKDSLELAYRFFLMYKTQKMSLTDTHIELLNNALINNFNSYQHTISLKSDKDKILAYLESNDINYFYHFTEEANLINIRKSRGLFSQRECLTNSIIPRTSGEMRHLRNKDAELLLEDYVRLSFCKRHPLIKGRTGRLVLLKIKIDVALFESTLFSDRDAALDNHEHGNSFEDLLKVHISATQRNIIDSTDPEFPYCQAEVMVKSFLPQEYIVNLDNPELL